MQVEGGRKGTEGSEYEGREYGFDRGDFDVKFWKSFGWLCMHGPHAHGQYGGG